MRHATISNQLEFQKQLWREKDKYVDQLYFINHKVEETISSILEKSERPPIIILQSDHGPQIYGVSHEEYLQARFSILAAFHLPGNPDIIDDAITPVNIFRILFNHYFDANFELLTNEHYFSPYEKPYNFEKVRFDDKGLAGNKPPASGLESR